MRISTAQITQRATENMLDQQLKVNRAQNQVATGKRIASPADDPTGVAQSLLLKQEIARVDRFNKNSDHAENALSLQEFHLAQLTNTLQRVRELHIQSSNDILGGSARASIQQELKELLDQMVSIANSTDSKGNYLYSGYQSASKPFVKDASGQYQYQGDTGQRQIEIASGMKVTTSDPGQALFAGFKQGNGEVVVTDPHTDNIGTAVVSQYGIQDPSAYVNDTYTVTFVTNGSGALAYQVVGATTGQVVPALPAVSPADAPAFVEGNDIEFNGLHLTLKGTPQVGDDFQVAPSQGQSVLNTIEDMIDYLRQPYQTPTEQAQVKTIANQSLLELDQALDQVLLLRTETGARMNVIDTARNINADLKLHSEQVLSSLENVDLAKAILELNTQTATLQASQQSFVRIQGLSLFNFL